MPHFYEFAIVRIAPDDARDERINIGLAIFQAERLDLRVSPRLQKLRAISGALSTATVDRTAKLLSNIDELSLASGSADVGQRYDALARVGILSLSNRGQFVANDAAAYEERVNSLLRNYVDPEAGTRVVKEKRSRLLTAVKNELRKERVMAKKDEGLESHRVVPKFQVADGLVADLALKNGVMHIVETVDASHDDQSLGKVIGEMGVSSLVLERARMNFAKMHPYLIYSSSAELEQHVAPSLEVVAKQGVHLYNWKSDKDQAQFLADFASSATPFEVKKNRRLHSSH